MGIMCLRKNAVIILIVVGILMCLIQVNECAKSMTRPTQRQSSMPRKENKRPINPVERGPTYVSGTQRSILKKTKRPFSEVGTDPLNTDDRSTLSAKNQRNVRFVRSLEIDGQTGATEDIAEPGPTPADTGEKLVRKKRGKPSSTQGNMEGDRRKTEFEKFSKVKRQHYRNEIEENMVMPADDEAHDSFKSVSPILNINGRAPREPRNGIVQHSLPFPKGQEPEATTKLPPPGFSFTAPPSNIFGHNRVEKDTNASRVGDSSSSPSISPLLTLRPLQLWSLQTSLSPSITPTQSSPTWSPINKEKRKDHSISPVQVIDSPPPLPPKEIEIKVESATLPLKNQEIKPASDLPSGTPKKYSEVVHTTPPEVVDRTPPISKVVDTAPPNAEVVHTEMVHTTPPSTQSSDTKVTVDSPPPRSAEQTTDSLPLFPPRTPELMAFDIRLKSVVTRVVHRLEEHHIPPSIQIPDESPKIRGDWRLLNIDNERIRKMLKYREVRPNYRRFLRNIEGYSNTTLMIEVNKALLNIQNVLKEKTGIQSEVLMLKDEMDSYRRAVYIFIIDYEPDTSLAILQIYREPKSTSDIETLNDLIENSRMATDVKNLLCLTVYITYPQCDYIHKEVTELIDLLWKAVGGHVDFNRKRLPLSTPVHCHRYPNGIRIIVSEIQHGIEEYYQLVHYNGIEAARNLKFNKFANDANDLKEIRRISPCIQKVKDIRADLLECQEWLDNFL